MNLATGIVLFLLGLWLVLRTWFGGLANRLVQGV